MQDSDSVAGIDWASQIHAVCVVAADGQVVDRFDVTHDNPALTGMVRRLKSAGVVRVAIERGDGPVVETLMAADLAVFVVPARQIKGLRSRYGQQAIGTTGWAGATLDATKPRSTDEPLAGGVGLIGVG